MANTIGVHLSTGQIVKPVSADSHTVEPESCYRDHIDPRFRDRAPHVVREDVNGIATDKMVIDGMSERVAIRALSSAGRDGKEDVFTGLVADTHRGGFESHARIVAQDVDGLAAEVVYPSFGMLLCGHPDPAYKNACLWAYNRWLQEFCSAHPNRIFGLGQTAALSPTETVQDLRKLKEMGFVGIMMPGFPETEEDYSHASWDPVWEACTDLGFPVSFHVIATSSTKHTKGIPLNLKARGASKLSGLMTTMRACQDVLSMFVFDGVFERYPKLRVVCAEAGAGWAPHFIWRMDHLYKRLFGSAKAFKLSRPPSEYFNENVYLTFQDDEIAFKVTHLLNPRRMLWASDFPHNDSTWPNSQSLLREFTAHLGDDEKRWILRENVIDLYKLAVAP